MTYAPGPQPAPMPSEGPGAGSMRPTPEGAPNVSGPDMSDANVVKGRTAPQDIVDALVDPTPEHVVNTASGKADGFDKCPRCGSTDIGYSLQHQALVCRYCRFEFNEKVAEAAFGLDSPIEQLRGVVRGSGTHDIAVDTTVVTLKCQGCGAEVVIKANESLQARCHWCRQVLSINQQIPNGAVPDAVLPFALTHEQGVEKVREFAGDRRFFATSQFKANFTPENVVGVYVPYMTVDGNLTATIEGRGEVTLRRYTRHIGNDQDERVSDIREYTLGRKFDFTVDDLIAETNSSRANMNTSINTNNVLNAILPFDAKNAVAYNSNYLAGFTSERRDLDIDDIDDTVESNFLSIARSRGDLMIRDYDRGVRWESEGLEIHGTRWVALYLPIWLYSYQDDRTGMIHYIAVNGRNGRTMGSVPVDKVKLFGCAALAAIATFAITFPLAIGAVVL